MGKDSAWIQLKVTNASASQDTKKEKRKRVKASNIFCTIANPFIIINVAVTDIDECREGKCQNGRCTNVPGSFHCICPPGFDISPDGTLCTDHDECKEIGMCTNGICINMDGSFKCRCNPGFKLSPSGYACNGEFFLLFFFFVYVENGYY